MSIFASITHLIIITLLGLQAFLGGLLTYRVATIPPPPTPQRVASSTDIFQNIPAMLKSFVVNTPAEKTAATSIVAKPKIVEQKSGQEAPSKLPSQKSSGRLSSENAAVGFQTFVQAVSTPAPSVATTKTTEAVNTEARGALVNILCVTKVGGYFKPISGSGVIIDGVGVVLTNAHVGQYFLLRDYPTKDNVDCIVRTGSPAYPKYHAQLLYLPPSWVTKNANQIIVEQATGTGENDYSFLLITSTVDGSPLPDLLPAVPLTYKTPARGDPVLLAAYPAGFLDGANIETNLYASSAFTNVMDLFSFDNNGFVDLISIGGTVVSQAGSSGGAVVRQQDSALLGIITTATAGDTTAARDLRAITLAHIDRSLAAQGKGGLLQVLSGNLQAKADIFNTGIGQTEKQKLIEVLER